MEPGRRGASEGTSPRRAWERGGHLDSGSSKMSFSKSLAFLLVLGFGAADAAEWKAGVARVDTSPTAPVRMAGYASRTKPSAGVAHPLFAKALALSDDG